MAELPPVGRGGGGPGEPPDLPKRERVGATKPITRQVPPNIMTPGGTQLPPGSGAITPWTGNTMDGAAGVTTGNEMPLAEVVRIITGIQLDTRSNIRRYMTTAPHGDGHIEIIYALNRTDMREELVVVVAAPPTGRTPAVKGFGPADMIVKLRGYDQYEYDENIMAVIKQARNYLRDYLSRLL